MEIRALLLPEFDQEMASTRRLLEAFPEGKLEFRPHSKSQTLQQLVSHLVNLPTWMSLTLETAELDFAAGNPTTPQVASREEALARFDEHVVAARKSLAAATDEAFSQSWTLRAGPKVFFSSPKSSVVRTFVPRAYP